MNPTKQPKAMDIGVVWLLAVSLRGNKTPANYKGGSCFGISTRWLCALSCLTPGGWSGYCGGLP